MSAATRRVGFLGAGAMGAGMVRRLLAAGHRVTVWERTPGRHAALAADGAAVARAIADVVRDADAVVGCLADTAVTRDVWLGADGVTAHARAGQTLIEHGTFDPALAAEIADAAARCGCAFLDAPVSGGPERARSGELVTMVGGGRAAFDAARGLLGAYAARAEWAGPSGSGQRLKLVNQYLVSVHVVAAAEASALVLRAGLDPAVAHAVLMRGWAASAMLDRALPRAAADDFADTGAPVARILEAQGMIADMMRDAGVDSRLLAPARAAFDRAVATGAAELDLTAVVLPYLT
ncbi:NAD(P)-dependent oxidoreductase [Roseisolibacter sp. H3M3-2]|uniref:NAD(P)-dependent oxidoreductase n=1 Tax=Roseisolibacter sp. H3M3-2 TaxID=3031323 RepID=UPI0023DB8C31|nr:NAD(P)-dependent oxidoreductase [Roseisolibacter sp. H3M3-2]MDF1506112.1 NAD(P)-dependent oxidoreductase [Roseisolibacter sp. H3M3-2]